MSSDEQRIAEIRARHHREVGYDYDEAGRRLEGDPECAEYGEAWPCDVAVLLAEIDALTSRLKQDETTNTAVIRANADEIADLEDVRDDLEANVNALSAQVVALREAGAVLAEYVEHQPFSLARLAAIEAWRAALAAASEGSSLVTTRTITMRCHCGRGVTIGPDPWCEGCVQSAATCDCVPATQGEG